MPCIECERLSREEIRLTRRASEADARLHDFNPEPPFGEAAVNEFHCREESAEQTRSSLHRARSEREAHAKSHALTMSGN